MSDDDSDDEWLVERVGVMGGLSRQERVALYRRRAAAVRAKADQVQDPIVRRQLHDIASQYEALATSIERLPPRGE